MPVKIESDFEALKRNLSAKLLRRQLVFSHVFTSRQATATDITSLKRKLASYWAHASGGVMMDTELTPIEHGLGMTIAGIFPRENLVQMHRECTDTWFELIAKNNRRTVQHEKIDAVDGVVPAHDITPMRNVISKIGVELEGGWSKVTPPGLRGDGSVFVNGIPSHTISGDKIRSQSRNEGGLAAGEISFGPYLIPQIPWGEEDGVKHLTKAQAARVPTFHVYDENGDTVYLPVDFYTLYPDVLDSTCGMHVHFSFQSPMIYSSFVDARFQPWLLNGLKKWGQNIDLTFPIFYQRLLGENRYCRPNLYEPTSQLIARTRTGVRYAAVNYCYTMHSTMEIRVLPMFPKIELAKRAIIELVRLINVWGEAKAPKPKIEYSPFIETEARE